MISGVVAASLHAQPLRLVGSTTVRGALEGQQPALEAAAGRPIEFSGTGTAAGLMSLVSGGADVAMLSSPLDDAARIVNDRTPGLIEPTQLHAEQIGEARIVFIVNPRNP